MLREDITRRMARRTLVDLHACTYTLESKRDMVEATKKTSRTATTVPTEIYMQRVYKLSGSLT